MQEYDFALSWSTKVKERFVNALIKECYRCGLSFLWCYDENVEGITKKLKDNSLRIRFVLDTEATYNKEKDPYAYFCYAAKDTQAIVVNDPDRARHAVDKSVMHYELINAGIDVPYSVVVRHWQPSYFKLGNEEKGKLGIPFVIKPACGYAKEGVIEEAKGSINEIIRARKFDPNDSFILQEKVFPVELEGKRAWFRVFHLFDKVIPCFWDDTTCIYSHITESEFRRFHLEPLVRIIVKIANISQMQWFSTEIAIDNKHSLRRFVAVDYVNDQCDMTSQSESPTGVPDSIVDFTACYMVKMAEKLINSEPLNTKYTVLLKDAEITLKGLGEFPLPIIQNRGPNIQAKAVS